MEIYTHGTQDGVDWDYTIGKMLKDFYWKGWFHNLYITSHSLARELLSKPDTFITISFEGKEYMIDKIRRVPTHANIDDSNTYLTLVANVECEGNIKRC